MSTSLYSVACLLDKKNASLNKFHVYSIQTLVCKMLHVYWTQQVRVCNDTISLDTTTRTANLNITEISYLLSYASSVFTTA